MRRIRLLLMIASLLSIGCVVRAQGLPTDRERDGLKGKVWTVTDSNIKTRAVIIEDSVWVKPDVVYDTTPRCRFLRRIMGCKIVPREEKKDTLIITKTTQKVPDTVYYCRTEYTPQGWLKNRVLVEKNGKHHEQTTTTYDGSRKVEMRTYCQESGVTTQWLYHYSDYGKISRLSSVTIIEFTGVEEGKIVEKILYNYENEGETCHEYHLNPENDTIRVLKYESGLLINENKKDTLINIYYNREGKTNKIEVCNAEEDVLYTDRYEYPSTGGMMVTRTYGDESGRRHARPKVTVYSDVNDGSGNWRRRSVTGEQPRTREINYY